MATVGSEAEQHTLDGVAAELRRATAAAVAEQSFLATTLDDCRVDVDRALTLHPDQQNPVELHALMLRAELALRTWRRLQTGSYRAVSGDRACSTCGRGTLVDVARANRMRRFRGIEVAVPETFAIPTCNYCHAESLDPAAAAQLDDALLSAYLWRKP